MELTKKQWEQIVRRLSDIEASIVDDRKDIDRIHIDIATIKEQNDRILSMQNRSQGKIETTVQNAVSETVEDLTEKVDTLIDKKILKIKPAQIEKLTWMQKLSKTVRGWR